MKGKVILLIWGAIILFFIFIYFIYPEFFARMFEYSGPGSPYINVPSG